jgi:hypothetical protein
MATNPWDNDPIVQHRRRGSRASFRAPRRRRTCRRALRLTRAAGDSRRSPAVPKTRATNDTLDDATTTFYAQQILAGAPMPAMGMGKVASQNRQKVMAKVAEIAGGQGLTGADLAKQIAHYQSGKKQLGTLETAAGHDAPE